MYHQWCVSGSIHDTTRLESRDPEGKVSHNRSQCSRLQWRTTGHQSCSRAVLRNHHGRHHDHRLCNQHRWSFHLWACRDQPSWTNGDILYCLWWEVSLFAIAHCNCHFFRDSCPIQPRLLPDRNKCGLPKENIPAMRVRSLQYFFWF